MCGFERGGSARCSRTRSGCLAEEAGDDALDGQLRLLRPLLRELRLVLRLQCGFSLLVLPLHFRRHLLAHARRDLEACHPLEVGPQGESLFGELDDLVGCDQPFLTATIVAGLRDRLGAAQLLMPRAEDRLQPLTAIYRTAVVAAADRLLAAGSRRPRELADAVDSAIVEAGALRALDPELRFLGNLNHPDDYRAAVAALTPEGDA